MLGIHIGNSLPCNLEFKQPLKSRLLKILLEKRDDAENQQSLFFQLSFLPPSKSNFVNQAKILSAKMFSLWSSLKFVMRVTVLMH